MHILHVVQLYHRASGAARYFIEIGERLVQAGHRVTVLTTDAFDLEHFWMPGRRRIAETHEEHQGVQVLRLPIRRRPGPPILYPVLRRGMVELARGGKRSIPLLRMLARLTPQLPGLRDLLASPALADVALVHTTNITLDFAILPLADWANARAIPHICTPFVHLGVPGDTQIVRYYTMPHQIDLLCQAARVIVQTTLERDFLRGAGVPDQRMETVGVGVDPAELAGGDGDRFRREQQLTGPLVLTLGAAAYDKGTIHVVEAMRRLWAQGSPAIWVQVGPLLDHFERFYATLSADERARTRLLGYVPDQTRRDALAAANLMAMPSRTDSFGIAYLEAWCYNLPVIGAQAGGVPEVIRDGVDGFLIPFGDTHALSTQIQYLLDNPTTAHTLGTHGKARVLQELTWEHKYAQVYRIYEGVRRT